MAMMKHECNTFSPVRTNLARFAVGQSEPYYGKQAYDAFKGTSTALASFISIAEAAQATFGIAIAAQAPPSGPVEDSAYKHMTDLILQEVSGGCDAILLDLHGAMVTESLEDGEGVLLARIRELAPNVPIGVALDMHANLYPGMVDNADVIAGYHTYPHIDHYDTGMRVARPILAMLRGEQQPKMAWGNRPMLPHVMCQRSDIFPNQLLQNRCKEMERQNALAVSLFTGFPHADIYNAGLSCVVVTDDDIALAEKLRNELLDTAWENRAAFVYEIEPLEESLARAKKMSDGPIVLLDHYDNAASGGTMDSMAVLKGILDAGLEDVAVFAIHDPGAVQSMINAGVGSNVTIQLGGKIDMPLIGTKGEMLEVSGKVKLISDGQYRNLGPALAGVLMDLGPSVVLDTGTVDIVVISKHQEPNDLACFLTLGIDPRHKRYLMLKSRVHYRAGFGTVAKATIECAGVGVCTSDYGMLDFKKVRRPIYPLDPINEP